MESLKKAFEIITKLIYEDCFDFNEVKNLSFNERKNYLHNIIYSNFNCYLNTINDFFNNEELVADVILFMDEDVYNEFEKELNEK